jgi:tripartite ATP-independent transporter DctM subunit
MGNLANKSEIIKDIFYFFRVWLNWLPGSMAMVTIVTSAMFAFSTGSSLASTAVMGKMTLPEMDRYNYPRRISLGTIVAGGSLGNLIPPSIGLVMYGMITNQSIGKLLLGAIFPGILATVLFMLTILLLVLKESVPTNPKLSITWSERLAAVKKIWGMFILIFLVLGSIFLGLATVTEASAVGAFGSLVIAILRRNLSWPDFLQTLKDTALTTTMIFLLIATVAIFSRFMTLSGVVKGLVGVFVTSGGLSQGAVIFTMLFIFLVAGCALDPTSLLLVVTPLVYPVVERIGFDPIVFGVMVVCMIEIGLLTPPVGMGVFVLKSVSDAPLAEIFRSITPFLAAWIVCVLLLYLIPDLVLFLPRLMF